MLTLAADAAVPPLALARPGQEAAWAAGTPAWTMGWGVLNARESPGGNRYFADRLRELQEPLQGDDACESVFGLGFPEFPYRPASVLCAGTPGDHAGTCSGDSGGPLVVGGPGSWLDVGRGAPRSGRSDAAALDVNIIDPSAPEVVSFLEGLLEARYDGGRTTR